MEFFVAEQVAERLKAGTAPPWKLTNAVASFVHYLLWETYEQPRIEDGMVYVPPGPFVFGSEEQSNLCVAMLDKGFWIDRYPVTNEEFCRFLDDRGNNKEGGAEWVDLKASRIENRKRSFSVKRGYEKHPVVGVSWHGASAYARWANKQLPTEQQWEKAARGIDGRRYPWGEDFSAERCNTYEGKRHDTSPVGAYGEKGRSPYGCEEMAGNVWEWTASRYSDEGEYKELLVVRGGSWLIIQNLAACACRSYVVLPQYRNLGIGFRCART